MFSTREPEEPDTGRSAFLPPTSPNIVISNFITSITEKHSGNYIACFTDENQNNENASFQFIPSADALAVYSSVFSSWGINSEQIAFNSLLANMAKESYPELTFSNSELEIYADSAVYTADYYLKINHQIASISNEFAGALTMSIMNHDNGQWSINRWRDLKLKDDTIGVTWSVLKAQFAN